MEIKPKNKEIYFDFPSYCYLTPKMISIITKIMISVDRIENLSGDEKKKLVIHVIEHVIKQSKTLDQQKKEEWIEYIRNHCPELIDNLIQLSKNINIKSTKLCCI
jgi:hypothetical protein